MIREATNADIPQIQIIRNLVKENVLSDPSVVSDANNAHYISDAGKGWVYESENEIIGFAIIDLSDRNIWALFIHPDHDRKGAGRALHDVMLNWYFGSYADKLWLGTTPNTRAESFYRRAGWKETGMHGKGEIKFEMTKEDWTENLKKDNKMA